MCDSWLGSTKTLFDDIRAEFLLRQLRDLALEGVAERVSEARLLKINNVLKDVVAKGILNQMERAVRNLADELGFLVTSGVVDATLQHATAMTMGSDRYTVGANSIKYELPIISEVLERHRVTYLGIFGRETIEAFLNDVIAVQILDKLYHLTIQSIDHRLDLLRGRHEFDHLLQSPRTVAIQSNLDHIWSGVVDQNCTLFVV